MRRRRVVAILLAALVASTGCTGETGTEDRPTGPQAEGMASTEPLGAPTPTTEPASPDPDSSLIATATVDEVEAFASPDVDGEPTHVLEHPTDVGAPRVFLVDERRDGWLHVLLPVRPNGTTGWIRSEDVELARTGYAIEVDLADFELRLRDEGELVMETPIGYGAEDTPTPGGRYYVTELLQPPDPGGLYGPYAFGLSGFSDVHTSFAGGEGVIGIHGTNDPSSIGNRVSNGCIRIANDVVTEMAAMLPLGTPVTITD